MDDLSVAQQKHAMYLEQRAQYIDAARESSRTFDKAMLAFGSGVFGFSIAFVKDVAPTPAPNTLQWLGAAWILFALGLLAILLSFLFSHRACLFEIDEAEKALADSKHQHGKNLWSSRTDWCNFLCIAFLFLGLVCWSVFALHNLGRGDQTMSTGETVKRGYVPPPPAKAPSQQQPSSPPPPANPPSPKK